jgi:hypothetical protein
MQGSEGGKGKREGQGKAKQGRAVRLRSRRKSGVE